MSTFQVNLVSPVALVFSGGADQADLSDTEGDFGALAGHALVVAVLRPGIVSPASGDTNPGFVLLGGFFAGLSRGSRSLRAAAHVRNCGCGAAAARSPDLIWIKARPEAGAAVLL